MTETGRGRYSASCSSHVLICRLLYCVIYFVYFCLQRTVFKFANMVMGCVAYQCNNVHNKNSNIQFHGFPFKRPEILTMWINAIRREDWTPSKSSKLCSVHFQDTDYQIRPGTSVKLLKCDAVPSIFSFPEHLLKKIQTEGF
ncbi:hypothetical protein HUJ04_011273 [Dendroctonus ponderosae]|nr:hypothetical protein HUJ04_011273 [Dendroctonus ponderosae]